MGFVQIIEYTTTRQDEIEQLFREWEQARTDTFAVRGLYCGDRDRPNTYLAIIEFRSYDEAMKNSEREDTSAYAEQFSKLCDSMAFRNLDVRTERTFAAPA